MEPDPDEPQHPGEEDLDWGDDTVKGKKPKSLYSKTTETARGLMSPQRACALFCGGKKCKYCLPDGWEEDESAIKGLYSHWVTDNILAMARPSNWAIEKYKLIEQFQDVGLNSILNLQIKGEHGDCGPEALDDSGFLYNPQTFMDKGIFFYNFGWPDYGVAALSTILDMVKVMQFAVAQGKLAVHCHAGRGRTGVIIACYLVFTNRITGIDAIHYVRDKRPNSIQTRQQMQVIQEFEQYLKPFRTVFASRYISSNNNRQQGSHEFSLQQYLNRQRHILHGFEARRLKHVPKIIYVVCERLLELAKKGSSLQKQQDKSDTDLAKEVQRKTSLSVQRKASISTAAILEDGGSPPPVAKSHSKDSLSCLDSKKKKRYKTSLLATRARNRSISLEDLEDDKFKSVLEGSDKDKESVGSSNSGTIKTSGPSDMDDEEDDDDDAIVFGNSTINLQAAANDDRYNNGECSTSRCVDRKYGSEASTRGEASTSACIDRDHVNKRNVDSDNVGKRGAVEKIRLLDNVSLQSDATGWSIDQSMTGQLSEECVEKVARAFSAQDVDVYVEERAADLEHQLNETDTAWTLLSTEGDPFVLAQILWDWLDQLKEPVLRAQELATLMPHVEDPEVGLSKVEKGTKCTLEYLVKVVSKLCLTSDDGLVNLYQKLLCHLSHQWVLYDDTDLSRSWAGSTISSMAPEEKEHWGDMRPDVAERLFRLVYKLQQGLANKSRTKLAP